MSQAASREAANSLFKSGDYRGAVALYSELLNLYPTGPPSDDACAVLTNRALCYLRLDQPANAEADCTRVLERRPGSEKALYRRALAREAQGRTRDALQDAGRLWQINNTDAETAKLLGRLRASLQGVGVNPQSGPTPATKSSSASSLSPHTLAACLSVLPPALAPHASEGASSASAVGAGHPGLGAQEAAALLRGLATVLQGPPGGEGASAGTLRAFCDARGPLRVAQLMRPPPAPPSAAGASPSSAAAASSAGPTEACLALLASLGGRVASAAAAEWSQAWPEPEAAPTGSSAGGAPGLYSAPLGPAAASALASLVEPVAQVLLPAAEEAAAAASGSTGGARLLESLVAASAELLRAAAAVALPAVAAARAATFRDKTNVSAGGAFLAALPLSALLPPPLRAALGDWARLAAGVLRHEPAAGPGPLQATAGAALASLLTTDAAALVLEDGGAVSAAALPLAALPRGEGSGLGGSAPAAAAAEACQRLRQACTAALSRALALLRDAHPLGHPEAGRLRLRRLLGGLRGLLVGDLGDALPLLPPPPTPAAATGGKGAAAAAAAAAAPLPPDADTGGILELGPPVPVGRPDWAPRPACAAMCGVLAAALLVEREEGVRLAAGGPGVLPALAITSAAAWPEWQALACSALSGLAGDEGGRAALAGAAASVASCLDATYSARLDFERGVLPRLADSRTPATRAAAAVSLAKLTTPAQAFGGGAAAAAGLGAGQQGGREGGHPAEAVAEAVAAVLIAAAGLDVRPRPAAAAASSAALAAPAPTAAAAVGAAPSDPLRIPFAQLRAAFDRRYRGAHAAGGPGARPSAAAVAAAQACDLSSACSAVEAVAAVVAGQARSKAWLAQSDAFLAALTRTAAGLAAATAAATAAPTSGAPLGDAPPPLSVLRPAAYGLAHLLLGLCVSIDALTAAHLAEQGVDVKQWRELQRLAMPRAPEGGEGSGGSGGARGAAEEEDPPAAVEARIRRLLDRCEGLVPLLGCLAAAAATEGGGGGGSDAPASFASAPVARKGFAELAAAAGTPAATVSGGSSSGGGGAATRELLARTLVAVTQCEWARGRVVAAGALPLLSDLAGGPGGSSLGTPTTLEGALSAGQAAARILISTQPSLVPPQQLLEAVPALLRVCRDSAAGLQQFEALLALTNVASVSPETQAAVAGRAGALGAIEVCQFSEAPQLRRAGTECLSNLATTERGRRLITESRLPLWLALAGEWAGSGEGGGGGDDALSSAALGGLAMALGAYFKAAEDDETGDGRAALAARQAVGRFVDQGAVTVACEVLLLPGRHALQHRAAAILRHLAAEPRGVAALLAPLERLDEGGADRARRGGGAGPSAPSAFTLLGLLAQGRDPAALAAAAAAAAGTGKGGAAGKGGPPAAIMDVAAQAALRCVYHLTHAPQEQQQQRGAPPPSPTAVLDRAWAAVQAAAAAPTQEELAAAAAAQEPPLEGVSELTVATPGGEGGGSGEGATPTQLHPDRPSPALLWALLRGVHAAVSRSEQGEGLPPAPPQPREGDEAAVARAVLELTEALVDHVGLA